MNTTNDRALAASAGDAAPEVQQAPCFAADGITPIINVPGHPLMVRAVDFNRLYGSVPAAPQVAAPADEREAFAQWISKTYPASYRSLESARKGWDVGCMGALAWQARSTLAAAPVPVDGGAAGVRPITLNGYQLRDALEFLAPDGTDEQLEQEVCIQYGPERTVEGETEPAGAFCWLSDYPEEGSIRLDEKPAADRSARAGAPSASGEAAS